MDRAAINNRSAGSEPDFCRSYRYEEEDTRKKYNPYSTSNATASHSGKKPIQFIRTTFFLDSLEKPHYWVYQDSPKNQDSLKICRERLAEILSWSSQRTCAVIELARLT